MKFRKRAREIAFLVLYIWDMRGESLEDIFNEVIKDKEIKSKNIIEYSKKLIETVEKNLAEIDSKIAENLKGWSIDRLGYVERNALRLGVAEILYLNPQDIGRVFVDILDIVKTYTGEKAAKFVNAVLSTIYKSTVSESKKQD